MKIVSTFLFADKYEADVLLCKLHSEYEFVDEFIGIESAYDLRDKYKGLYLRETLSRDCFKPFLDKITVLSSQDSLFPKNSEKVEQNHLICEFNSRGYCWDYIQSKYEDGDWVIMEDADEMLDFSNPLKRDILIRGFSDYSESIQWQNLKFWWDFDNLNLNPDKYIPCHKVGALKEREHPFYNRNYLCKRLEPILVCGIEYSYCFPKEGNWKKVNTAAHDKYQYETMELAYQYNIWHKEPLRGEFIRYPYDFFERIELTPENSTEFVRENIDALRVNTVDPNYAENRLNHFQCYPHPCEQAGLMRGNRICRQNHYYRRNK